MKALMLSMLMVAASGTEDCAKTAQQQGEQAQTRYKAFLTRMYPAEAGIVVYHSECVDGDSDGDGYVSCSATLHDAKGTIFRDVSECGWREDSGFGFGIGCRAPKASIRQ